MGSRGPTPSTYCLRNFIFLSPLNDQKRATQNFDFFNSIRRININRNKYYPNEFYLSRDDSQIENYKLANPYYSTCTVLKLRMGFFLCSIGFRRSWYCLRWGGVPMFYDTYSISTLSLCHTLIILIISCKRKVAAYVPANFSSSGQTSRGRRVPPCSSPSEHLREK